jgi:hypothetical protein
MASRKHDAFDIVTRHVRCKLLRHDSRRAPVQEARKLIDKHLTPAACAACQQRSSVRTRALAFRQRGIAPLPVPAVQTDSLQQLFRLRRGAEGRVAADLLALRPCGIYDLAKLSQ